MVVDGNARRGRARRRPARFGAVERSPRTSGLLRVVTLNLHHGAGPDGRLDLERSAAALAALDPDVVGLQEVDRHWSARSGWLDQAETLARWLGLHLAYGAALERSPTAPGQPVPRYGNAVLSLAPIVQRSTLLLPPGPGEDRILLRARIALEGGALDVHVTHLEPRDVAQRAAQAAAVAAAMRATASTDGVPALLLGDLNAEVSRARELAPLRDLLADAWVTGRGTGRGGTFPARRPRERIDVVLHTPGLAVRDVRVGDAQISDHRPLLAVLDLPG